MAILVTGGAGYIGSHTCIELLNAGYDIVVLDNFLNSKPKSLERVKEITGKSFAICEVDLLKRRSVENIFTTYQIDAVIHFAGLKAAGESIEAPLYYYHNNITGTIILLDLMYKYNVKKLVFSSSATVYGKPNRVPISEDFPLKPYNPYGRTKLIIEEIIQDLFVSDSGWSCTLLRYFNPIGAHESGRIGEDPNGIPNNLMPYITQVAIGKLQKLNVYGNDYDTIDGTGVRDYIHVVDLAIGHLKALQKVMSSFGVEAYNLGTGIGYSVLEVISAFENVSGLTIPYQTVNRRKGDIGKSFADPSKAIALLGWKAERGISEMCRDSWNWQKMNPNGYESGKNKYILK